MRSRETGFCIRLALAFVAAIPLNAQYVQQGPKLVGTGAVGPQVFQGQSVALSADGRTAVVGGESDNGGVGAVWAFIRSGDTWSQQGSKLVGTGAVGASNQGSAVALSADGSTALVGGSGDNGNGAAWVYTRSGTTWTQQGGKLIGSGATSGSQQGYAVALSADGNTAAIGAPLDTNGLGAVWIFTRTSGVWSQQGSKLVGTGSVGVSVYQGKSVALSADGNTVLIGADHDNANAGATWAFTRSGSTWTQQGSKLVGTGAVGNAAQGGAVALSADGNTALVGGPFDNNLIGAVWAWTRSGSTWVQQGSKLVGTGSTGSQVFQGQSVALSTDGNMALVGGPYDNSLNGAAWAWTRSSGVWAQRGAKLIGSGAIGISFQGAAVALSADGGTALVGGPLDNSNVGSVWVYSRALRFVPVTPCRIVDTRLPTGPFGGPLITGGTSRDFLIPNSGCSIPQTAYAYSMNVTVVPRGLLGYLTVWPSGQPQTVVSTLNSIDGRVKANAAIVPAGGSGGVSVYATDDTDVILDISGYFVPSTDVAGLAYYPVEPCRVADTRNPTGALGGPFLTHGATRGFPIPSSNCQVPLNAQAYSLNLTAVPRGFLGYLSVWPAGQSQPLVSTLNAYSGTVTANAAIVPAGTNGNINVYVTNDTDLVIDINGYFAPAGSGGQSLYTLAPCRVLDTRLPSGSPPFAGQMNTNPVASACAVPQSVQSYVFNATVVPNATLGYLTLWPQGAAQPLVSTLNALDGVVTSNMAIVPTSNGSVSAYATDLTYLVLDVFAYFAP